MSNEHSTYYQDNIYSTKITYLKYVFGLSFLLRQGQELLLEIHNHPVTLVGNPPRKVKDAKMAQVRNSP